MPGSWAVPEPTGLMPLQQPLPPKGDAGLTELALALSSRSEEPCGDRTALGLGGIAGEGVPLQTGAEPCVYKAWGSSPAGLFSTTTPRLTWQHGQALPECQQLNPEAPECGSDLPMGLRLLLVLALLQAGEYHPSVPLPCHASPCPATASPCAIGFACFVPGPPCDVVKRGKKCH